jgi:hypothetical protein
MPKYGFGSVFPNPYPETQTTDLDLNPGQD